MATKWAYATNSGVGFITHDDWKTVSFAQVRPGLFRLEGDDAHASAWITRVGGTEITAQEASDYRDAWDANLYTYSEFFLDKLTAQATVNMMQLALGDNNIRDIFTYWMQDIVDVRQQVYKDGIAYLLAQGHITQVKHDELLENKQGIIPEAIS